MIDQTDFQPHDQGVSIPDFGIVFQRTGEGLYAATPAGTRCYAEDWVALAWWGAAGSYALTQAGADLEAEVEGIIAAAVEALA